MSINEIIKKHLSVKNQKLSLANKKYNYCFFYNYQNNNTFKKVWCTKRLVYQCAKKINENRWHLHFRCLNNHSVVRWVIIGNNNILAGQVKN